MKKIFVSMLAFLTIAINSNAQIDKGKILLGGQVNYHSNSYANLTQPNSNKQETKGGNFSIAAGKAIKENTVLGVNLGYGSAKANNAFNGTTYYNSKLNQYNAGVFYRRYKKLAREFYLFGEAGTNFSSSKRTDAEIQSGSKTVTDVTGINLTLMPGLSYKLCKKMMVEITLPDVFYASYATYKITPQTGSSKQEIFNTGSNLNRSFLDAAGIGFRFML